MRVVYTPPKYPLTASDYLAVDARMMPIRCSATPNTPASCGGWSPAAKPVNNHQFYLSRRDYLAQHGDIMRRLLTELTHTGQFIDSHRGEAARLLGRAVFSDARRSLSMALACRSHRLRPMDPSGDPRPADHRRSLYAPGLSLNHPVRAVWYGEPAPDVIRPLMAVSVEAKFARYLPDCSGADSLDLMAMLP
ncbi:hypothetical protein MJ585_22335 [Klebsiella pneumoniae]|nr:hypothetical protein MJ585_22335 [Klebsiella pneumoniae]